MRSVGLLFILFCLLVSACDKGRVITDREGEHSENETSFPEKSKEVHFLFFDAGKGSKALDFYVEESLNDLSIRKIRLFQGDTAVSDYLTITKGQYHDNKLGITLYDCIAAFDRVELSLSGEEKKILLPIGQYYMDRMENLDDSVQPEEAYSLVTAHSQTQEAGYTAEATFSKGKSKAHDLHLRLPRSFDDTGYEKDFEKLFEDAERVEYVYGLRIPKRYYEEHHVESVNVEILWTEPAPGGKERYVFQEYVPLDL
ncbi:hypothetical protein B9G55_03495 [Saccharibacillus sp. O16]|nr:hypothetical protein B9G55_03495 [Saccharibacillus sp. O16]